MVGQTHRAGKDEGWELDTPAPGESGGRGCCQEEVGVKPVELETTELLQHSQSVM